MMWDILPDISVRETGGSTLCTSAATVGDYTLLSIFSWPTPHSVIMQCGITGERGYRQKGEETQDVRAVPVPSSKSSSSVRTLLGDPGRVITELYVNKKHNTKVRFMFVWLQKPQVVFANITAADKWENSLCSCTLSDPLKWMNSSLAYLL